MSDIISKLFTSFVELSGDGRVGRDCCIRGGLALFEGRACIVLGTYKGHTPQTMQEANYGMASPHGYRTALRLMRMAEHFKIPVITLVDTVGAWPTFECENDGQSEAIATNLTAIQGGYTLFDYSLTYGTKLPAGYFIKSIKARMQITNLFNRDVKLLKAPNATVANQAYTPLVPRGVFFTVTGEF